MNAFRTGSSRPSMSMSPVSSASSLRDLSPALAKLQPVGGAGAHDRLGVGLVERDHSLREEVPVEEREERPQVPVLALQELADPGSAKLLVQIVEGLGRREALLQLE